MKSRLLNILVVFGLIVPGFIMPGTALADTGVFINEIHYDNAGTDTGEAVEIAAPADTDLTGWSLVLYNGSNGTVYGTDSLGGTIPDLGGGFGLVVVNYPSNGLQNGSPDGIALVDASGTVMQFLSYEGTFTAQGGPADGLTSTDIGVSESSGTLVGDSLQLIGSGTTYGDFSWASASASTFGAPNTDQTFGGAPTAKALVINEIDYDQPGTDAAEFVEIRNNDSVSVDLSAYSLQFVNGNGGAVYDTINLPTVSLAAGDYFVVCANAATVANCDLDDSPDTNFIQNGAPDAVALYFGSTLIDTVSYEGDTVAPYTEGSGAGLVDDAVSATEGISRCADGSDTDQNNVDFSLREITPGVANACSIPLPDVFINELRISGSPDAEYFELQGDPGTSLDGLAYVVLSGEFAPGQIDDVVDLTGYAIPADGFFVAANSTAVSSFGITPDLSDPLSFFGSPTTHMVVSGFTGSAGDDLDVNNDGVFDNTPWSAVVDSVSLIDGDATMDYSYSGPVVGPDGNFTPAGTYRCDDAPAGSFDNNQLSFSPLSGTPGESNASLCVLPVTKIHDVQGNGSASPLVGQTVAIEGIVVGDFQDGVGANGDLNGFFVQEENFDADDDPATSEGVFVFQGSNPTVDVAIGDHVRVEGSVSEFFGDTQITSFSGVTVNSSGNPLPTASVLSLPVTAIEDFEAYEGMYVTFAQALVISEYFNFDRFGEIVLTDARHFQPTAVFEPGSVDAANLATANSLARITLDDGRTNQNPDPAIHPNGLEFGLTNLFRGGDTVANVTGVINYSFGLYRVQPTQGAVYTSANPRTAEADDVGGNLKVASFNVLNYFTSIDFIQDDSGPNNPADDVCGPEANQECRGADNDNEFERQRAKIISALTTIDADVVGLIEIENHPTDAALADLVSGLNDVMGAGTYEYVATGPVGPDVIRVAFIYKPASVTPFGSHTVLDTPAFLDPNNTGSDRNRAALAQTFSVNSTGGVFTAVVNHLKSKGSGCGAGDDDPEQGSCNLTRTLAAQELLNWLATDPTNSDDEDFVIIGDLNAYDKEDPIDVFVAGGYTDLADQYQGEYAYSYVFSGQWGYLDYALANAALLNEVTGATVWHINADEADLIDYDTSFKGPNQDAIYAPDAYRSSDHDPVIVGMELTTEAEIYELISDVQKLYDDGVLNGGQANALTSKLENVLAKIAKGDSNAAANQLGAFINQVEDFVIEGILTTDQGDGLIKAATLLVEVLSLPGQLVQLQVLAFNDYHGHLEASTPGMIDGAPAGGSEYLSAMLTQLREGNKYSLTVAAGDLIGGSPAFSGLFHDEPSVESLNAMHLDVSGVGNHEFDEGVTELLRMQNGGCHPVDGCYFPDEPYAGADFQWLAANVVNEETGETPLPPYWIKKIESVKVGFIGMTLEATDTLVAAAGIQGWDFLDEAETANALVPILKAQGVETIIVLLHEGGSQTPPPGAVDACVGVSGPVVAINNALDPEIDVLITGHTHLPYNCVLDDANGQPRIVTSAYSYGRVVSEIDLVLDKRTDDVRRDLSEARNHTVFQADLTPDPALTAVLDKWQPLYDAAGNTPVGTITADINRGGDPTGSDRGVESSAGNLVADAQLWATSANFAEVAFMNPGGVRSDLTYAQSAGEGDGVVTFGEAFTFQPFGNTLLTFPMTGAQIVSVLEEQCQPLGTSRPFLHLGVSEGFTYDLAKTIVDGNCTSVTVSNVQLNGVPLDPEATYNVTANNFLADGGDNFATFATVTGPRLDGGNDLEALVNYLGTFSPVAPPNTDRVNELP